MPPSRASKMDDSIYYLSGPMLSQNYLAEFDRVASHLRAEGKTINSPTETVEEENVPFGWAKSGLNKLTQSTDMVLFGDWKNARGCLLEIAVAVTCGIRLWTYGWDGTLHPYNVEGPVGSVDDIMEPILLLLVKQNARFRESNRSGIEDKSK